jgi:actin cytoskeleton-regulatory complex protein PAN1
MAQQWNQPGYQYPQQTGFQQPPPTGYSGGGSGFLQPQRTGFAVPNSFTPQQQGPVPPVPPLPQGFQSSFQTQQQQFQPPQQQFVPNNNNLSGSLAQQQRFLSPSPGVTGPLMSQPTGIGGALGLGAARPLISQPTGYNDPRLQLMSNTFMPGNISQPYAPSGIPQFAPGGFQGNLQQSFQQHNQQQRGTAAPKIPWALSKDERKNYDQIFRAWDTSSSGFISGETASEVFGQSGLDRNDLAQIWCVKLYHSSSPHTDSFFQDSG